jgi:hypothetical protein
MSCVATGIVLLGAAAFGKAAGMAAAVRPATLANHPPTLGAAIQNDGTTALPAGCGEGLGSTDRGCLAAGPAFVISWTTNLWSGDRLDEITVKRAPLFEH